MSVPVVPTIGGVVAAGAGASRMRKRMHRGKYKKGGNTGHTRFEEIGLVDILIFFVLVAAAIAGFTLGAALAAFGLGIAVMYSFDTATAKAGNNKRQPFARRQGIARYVEELGILEAVLIILTIYLLVSGHVVVGIFALFIFGAAFAMMVDKAKVRREVLILSHMAP